MHVEADAVFVASFVLNLHRSNDREGEHSQPYCISPIQLHHLLLTDHVSHQRNEVFRPSIAYFIKPFSDEHLIDLHHPTKRLQVSAMVIIRMRDEHSIDLRDAVTRKRSIEHLGFVASIHQERLSPAHESKAISLANIEHDDTIASSTHIQE